ncbi:MAG: tetratricopeptide repeat protein, partial [Planctomycetota bacterium]
FGYLLLFDLDDATRALPKFQAAVQTGRARKEAHLGLARCEIRVGQGARGHKKVMQVLDQNPQDALAGLVLAEYHLRSEHYDVAANIYISLIAAYPTVYPSFDWYYEALRGFQSLCAQTGHWQDAVRTWEQALQLHPDSRELRSFRVWSLACAGNADTAAWANELLSSDPDNPLACLSLMLPALRAGRIEEAVAYTRQARGGTPIPHAREFERAAAVLRIISTGDQPIAEAGIIEGVIYIDSGHVVRGRRRLQEYATQQSNSPWIGMVKRLLAEAPETSEP